MKARPILMSAPMVRALLEGRKTQTRRIVKQQPIKNVRWDGVDEENPQLHYWEEIKGDNTPTEHYFELGICPYGKLGDLLWVRENLKIDSEYGLFYSALSSYSFGNPSGRVYVNQSSVQNVAINKYKGVVSSIHMPRWASRLTLEIIDVRVERLQDCSEADAIAEGAEPDRPYGTIWKSINGQESWDANPWVWALTFKVHQQNVDDFMKARAA